MKKSILITVIVALLSVQDFSAQKQKINWLTFEQLEDSLRISPKKVFLFFYADWCEYCKKMEKVGFTKPDFIQAINTNFYAVKMNAESRIPISFDGRIYRNKNVGKSRNPNHELALLLASRKNYPLTLPATILLNEEFRITEQYFTYLAPKKLIEIVTNN